MNVVLSALIIVLLLYPGIFFRSVYFRGNRFDGTYKIKYNVLRQPVWEQVTASIIPAFLIHTVCIQIINLGTLCGLWDLQINYNFLYSCLLGKSIDQTENVGQHVAKEIDIGWYLLEFFVYLILTFAVALLAAACARDYVFRNKLDSKYPLLRFANEWFYWLTGRILETNPDMVDRTVDLIGIHILTETKENTIIYDGFLYDFTLSETGNSLDRLVLFHASKSVFKKTSTSRKQINKGDETIQSVEDVFQSELYERAEKRQIQQEYIIVPYSQIRNLTITYIDLQSDENKNGR